MMISNGQITTASKNLEDELLNHRYKKNRYKRLYHLLKLRQQIN